MWGSPPAWGVWIEINSFACILCIVLQSPPAWGVWIEIYKMRYEKAKEEVTPRMGGLKLCLTPIGRTYFLLKSKTQSF